MAYMDKLKATIKSQVQYIPYKEKIGCSEGGVCEGCRGRLSTPPFLNPSISEPPLGSNISHQKKKSGQPDGEGGVSWQTS